MRINANKIDILTTKLNTKKKVIDINIIKLNNKYYIEVYTKEFGNVLLFEDDSMLPLSFKSRKEAINEIKKRMVI